MSVFEKNIDAMTEDELKRSEQVIKNRFHAGRATTHDTHRLHEIRVALSTIQSEREKRS